MLVEIKLPVNRQALELGNKSVDEALVEANAELAKEGKKHFGAGKITVGRLSDGRFYFRHLALGTMVRIPDDVAADAVLALLETILPAVRLLPPEGTDAVDGVHGIWARQGWVDNFVVTRRTTRNMLEAVNG